jgi:hypothetical protein
MSVLKYKNAAGEWKAITNYTVQPITPVQTTGSSTIDVMSQNAVTTELNKKANSADVYTKTDANNTFLSQATASSTYLTKTEANNTYVTETEVNQIVYGSDTKPENPPTVVTTENLTTTLTSYSTTTEMNNAISSAVSGKADKATTLAGYGITDAKISAGTITLGTNTITPLTSIPSEYVTESELSSTLSSYATSSSVSSAISEASFNTGHNSVTSITSVPVTKRLVIATISASASLALASVPADGREIHIIVKNSSSSDITVTMPSASGYVKMSGDTLTVKGSSYADINIISDGTNMYIRAL